MPVTQVGAIYATGSRLLQRVYIPHADDSEIAQQHIAAGETLTSVPIATYRTGGTPAIQASIGAPTFSGRCAVVDKNSNLVTTVIIADPAIYADPDGSLVIIHDLAIPGDLWTGTIFTRRYVEINPHAATALLSIVAVSVQNIATAVPGTVGNILMPSTTLNVGSVLPAALFTKLAAM